MLVVTEDLEQLAETCLATAKTIKQYLASNDLPQMSFDQNGPSVFPPANKDVQFARLTLQEAAQRLLDLTAGPEVTMGIGLYYKLHDLNAFRYAYRYGLAQAVPIDASISYSALANKLCLDISQLKQFLRHLMHIHTFAETPNGEITHTAASRLLLNDRQGAMSAWVVEDCLAIVSKQIEAIEKWGHGSQEPTQTALNYAFNTDKYLFGFFEDNKPIRDRFANTMTWVSGFDSMSYRHILSGFDWSSLPANATVVDVAGNMGACLIPIAEANPSLKIVVQDLPEVIKRASSPTTTIVPPHLKDRFEFQVQDFFQPQQIHHADVYFQRMSFQNYGDKYAVKLLQSLIPALGPNSRILISDQVLPKPGAAPGPIERFMRAQDLQMLLLLNAKQRDYEQWEELFRLADERLRIKNVVTPPGSIMSFLEVVLDGEKETETT